MQASVNGGKHRHSLLDLGKGRADGRILTGVSGVIHRGLDDALASIDQEAQKIEQNGRRRVERKRHSQFPHVIDVEPALDLLDLGRLDAKSLTAFATTLELQHGGRVLDVCRVQQCTQSACGRCRQTADHVDNANGVGPAPRHEGELHEPLEFFLSVVVLSPVAVDAQDLARGLVHADDIGRRITLDLGSRVNLEDRP